MKTKEEMLKEDFSAEEGFKHKRISDYEELRCPTCNGGTLSLTVGRCYMPVIYRCTKCGTELICEIVDKGWLVIYVEKDQQEARNGTNEDKEVKA